MPRSEPSERGFFDITTFFPAEHQHRVRTNGARKQPLPCPCAGVWAGIYLEAEEPIHDFTSRIREESSWYQLGHLRKWFPIMSTREEKAAGETAWLPVTAILVSSAPDRLIRKL